MSVYILDPVCLKIEGHNLTAIKRYGTLLYNIKQEPTFLLTSKHLGDKICLSDEGQINVDRIFSHYYPDYIHLDGVNGFKDAGGDYKKRILDLASQEISDFFKKYKPGVGDTIFYPSVDYFSLAALVGYMENGHKSFSCKVVMRFIGVMEYNHYQCDDGLEKLLSSLSRFADSCRIDIKFSAESEAMASYVGGIIKRKIEITPTLVNQEALKFPENKTFTIVFPGAARRDKGFDRIESILNSFERLRSPSNYRALVQLLSPAELKLFGSKALSLVKNAKVTLLPCVLDEDEIIKLFEVADVIVAPYDQEVYKYRSSAIMAEAAAFGRPIVASNYCGFSKQIEEYKLGKLANSDEDFAAHIDYFQSMGAKFREAYGMHARKNFTEFSNLAYCSLFQ